MTKYCKKHASGVWMEYLKSAMPILKSAELTTQSNRRMNCLGEVSNCFLKACKDRIDPNNKEGSYDLCLAQPDAVKHLCQKQLNECGKISKDGDIFEIVKLRLGAMRVDSCTKQVKECLTNEDSCGKDYANCIGMDLESFKSICPVQKLVACSVNGKNIKSMDELDNMLQGIYISIDNKMATACQARVDEIFNKECPEGNCERLFESTKIDLEKNSPIKLDKKDNGDYVLSGLIHYGALKIEKKKRFLNDNSGVDNKNKEMMDKEERDLEYHINIEDYLSKIDEKDDPYKNRVSLYLDKLDSSVSSVINKFKSDPVISKCINGRDLRQINGKTQGVRKRSFTEGRFPSLLDSVSNSVMKSAIDVAQSVYADTYAKELKKMTDSQSEEVKKAMCYAMTANTASWKCNKWKWWYCSEWEYADMMDSLFTGKEGQILGERGGKYSTSYTMAGAKLSEMLKLTKSANKTLYTTDPKSGSMLGSSEITTTYSEGICYLKTVSTSCKNVKDIWEDKHIATKKGGGGFISVFGAAGWGYSHPIIRPQYSGQRCTEFNEPKESIQQIKI